ncbi:MAG: hypothetical protein EBV00_05400, partial [Burkholderiaceae bacterium]|nr:hypothetical protein [Burkholderiaceae bacterium]
MVALALPLLAPLVEPLVVTAASVAVGAAVYIGKDLFPELFLPKIQPNLGLLDQLGKGISQIWGQLSSFIQSLIPPYEIDPTWQRVQFITAGQGATGSLNPIWIPHPALYDASVYQSANIPANAQLMLFSRFRQLYPSYYGYTYEFMWNGGSGWLEAGLFNEKVLFEGSHAHLTWPVVTWVHTKADGSSVPLIAAPFVGNPPRTKVPLKRRAAVLPQTKAAVTPLPLPNPTRLIPPIKKDSPNDTPQPLPEFQPETKPTPDRPKVVPSVFPSPVKTTPTNPDGSRQTAPIVGPITTPVGSEKIGPITIPKNSPQPTLEGIAGEVGRIEQKLASMIRPSAGDDLTDRIGLLGSILKAIYEQFFTGLPAGEYILSSPCERDEQGDRVEYQVPILQTVNKYDAIFERL